MLDQAIRFGHIISQSDFPSTGRILEVGSGATGITAFINNPTIGVDLDFKGEGSSELIPIKGSVTSLPMPDRSFETVVCSDMLEHLPEGIRQDAIKELLRVTDQTLFIACPCGASARNADRFLNRCYEFFSIPTPDWLKEHNEHRLPERESIGSAIRDAGFPYRELNGEPIFVHIIVTFLVATRFSNNLWRSLFLKRLDRARKIASFTVLSSAKSYRKLWVVNCSVSPSLENKA